VICSLGFEKVVGCTNAIFAFKTTVGHFVNNGSCVYAAALDVSKAFDRVNHFKLFRTLVNSRIPLAFIDVLCHWSGKLCCVVRWRGMMSTVFSIGSGVRQGGTLSPALLSCL